jgi:hypothetical protein
MSKHSTKTPNPSASAAKTLKPFTGLDRVQIKVPKPGALNLDQEIQRLRNRK